MSSRKPWFTRGQKWALAAAAAAVLLLVGLPFALLTYLSMALSGALGHPAPPAGSLSYADLLVAIKNAPVVDGVMVTHAPIWTCENNTQITCSSSVEWSLSLPGVTDPMAACSLAYEQLRAFGDGVIVVGGAWGRASDDVNNVLGQCVAFAKKGVTDLRVIGQSSQFGNSMFELALCPPGTEYYCTYLDPTSFNGRIRAYNDPTYVELRVDGPSHPNGMYVAEGSLPYEELLDRVLDVPIVSGVIAGDPVLGPSASWDDLNNGINIQVGIRDAADADDVCLLAWNQLHAFGVGPVSIDSDIDDFAVSEEDFIPRCASGLAEGGVQFSMAGDPDRFAASNVRLILHPTQAGADDMRSVDGVLSVGNSPAWWTTAG